MYRMEMNPPGQSIIDALNTTTLHIYIQREEEHEPPIGQSIIYVLHTIALHIYIEKGNEPPGQLIINA